MERAHFRLPTLFFCRIQASLGEISDELPLPQEWGAEIELELQILQLGIDTLGQIASVNYIRQTVVVFFVVDFLRSA